ncbi:hypothetical protein GCM10007315_16730 [Gemmobacter tilapiae]|uniref:Uncharacterized protein n=1 Tax=Neogemmobacter tilapiae TaxID=875041 RepID=A0A918WJX6_9RHOB|nr:hypothetical protein GCM10007315_16730 [Gemmobacter tilapiae]
MRAVPAAGGALQRLFPLIYGSNPDDLALAANLAIAPARGGGGCGPAGRRTGFVARVVQFN